MSSEIVLSELQGGVGIVTLNRPEGMNSLTVEMMSAIQTAMESMRDDPDVKVVVLTAVGKAFCVGVDLKELSEGGNALSRDKAFMESMTSLSKPLIGAINGFAVTGGLELALYCDFLYAADSAKFADTHTKVGLLPTWGMSQKLPRMLGMSRAKELSLTGRFFSAEQAKKWGMVNEVLTQEEVLPAAIAAAKEIALNDSISVSGMQRLFNEGANLGLEDALKLEDVISRPHNASVDMSAMLAKLEEVKKRR